MVPLTIPETARLIAALTTRPLPPQHVIHWNAWTRRHQARARWFHQRARLKRDYALVSYQLAKCGCRTSEAPPLTAEVPADLVFSACLYDFGRAHAGTRGHERPTAAARYAEARPTHATGHATQSGWSGPCLQMWSERFRQYAAGKLDSSVQKLGTEDR
jgi:hypothetical protein